MPELEVFLDDVEHLDHLREDEDTMAGILQFQQQLVQQQ